MVCRNVLKVWPLLKVRTGARARAATGKTGCSKPPVSPSCPNLVRGRAGTTVKAGRPSQFKSEGRRCRNLFIDVTPIEIRMDITCNECGSSNWNEVLSDSYPERRRDRDQTVKTVYTCRECGAEGRHFEHQDEGTEQLSGAMRQ